MRPKPKYYMGSYDGNVLGIIASTQASAEIRLKEALARVGISPTYVVVHKATKDFIYWVESTNGKVLM